MIILTEFQYYFWLAASLFFAACVVVISIRWQRLVREMRTMAADNSEMMDVLSHDIPHTCHPPTFGARTPDHQSWTFPKIGSDWVCICGSRYVLIAAKRHALNGPYRLDWITEWELRNEFRPPWDRQHRSPLLADAPEDYRVRSGRLQR